MKSRRNALILSVAFGLLFWVLDALLDHLFLHDQPFAQLLTGVPGGELLTRLIALVGFLLLGLILSTRPTPSTRWAQRIQAPQQNLAPVLDTMVDGMVIVDCSGRIVYANRAAEVILEISRKRILSKAYRDRDWRQIDEQGRPYPLRELPLAIALGEQREVKGLEHGIVAPDGRVKWLSVNAAPLLDPQGELYGAVASFRDITSRKQTERALRESERRYRLLLESISDGAYALDRQWRYVVVNEAAAQLVNTSKEDLLGARITDLFPGIEETVFFHTYRQVMKSQKPCTVVDEFTFRDGRKGWYEVRVYPVPEGILCISTDITARKRAEQALRASEEKFRTLFDNAGDAIFIHDTEGRFLEANRAACQRLGYSREELLQMTPADIDSPTFTSLIPERLRQLQREGRAIFETAHVSRDGREIPIEISAQLVEFAGQPAVLSIARDISERKEAEEALRNALEESRQRQTEVSALLEDSRAVLERQEFPDAARAIFDACRGLIGAQAGYVALLNEQGDENEVLFLEPGDLSCTVDPSLPMPIRGLRAEAYRSGEPVYCNEFTTSEWVKYLPLGHVGLENVLFAPLVSEGEVAGLLGLANKPGGFTPNDARMARAFSEFAAIALHNSRMLESLQASEERYRALFNNALETILVSDDEARFIDVNPAACELTGYSREELLQQSTWDITPMVNREQGRGLWQAFLDAGEQRGEYIILRKGGATVDTEYRAVANILPGVHLSVLRDVTKRKRAEQALAQSVARLALLNDIGSKIAAVLELDTVLERAVHLVQQSFGYHHVALFTLDREEEALVMQARAGSFENAFPPGHRLQLGQGVVGWVGRHGQALLANDVETEPRYVNLYPEVVPTRSELSVPIRVGQEVIGVLDVQSPQRNAFNDNDIMVIETLADQVAVAIENARLYEAVEQELAERRRAEKALERRTEQLARSNAELQQFAYVASHDLQEPLRMVSSYVQLLARRYQGRLDEDADDFIAYAVDGANRMQDLIRGLLEYSRAGSREREVVAVDCEALLKRTLSDLQVAIQERGAEITCDPLPTVWGDPLQLGQVLQNLITNALKFQPAQEITKEPPRIHLSAQQENGEWVFSIQDNGIGIEEEQVDRIFLIFQRLHTREEYSGTGIGLALCKKIVEQHGGRIWVESEPGRGSTFFFSIPDQEG